jgi:hypothetical protein
VLRERIDAAATEEQRAVASENKEIYQIIDDLQLRSFIGPLGVQIPDEAIQELLQLANLHQ